MPGICTSVIRQELSRRRSDFMKSSADAKAAVAKPSNFTRHLVASRNESSSSTIDMMVAGKAIFFPDTGPVTHHAGGSEPVIAPRNDGRKPFVVLYRGIGSRL